jgi:hypothetical protein
MMKLTVGGIRRDERKATAAEIGAQDVPKVGVK